MSQLLPMFFMSPERRTHTVRPGRDNGAGPAARKIVEVMPKSELKSMKLLVLGLCLALSQGIAGRALAFDPESGISKESGPFDLFKFGFFSYKEGRKRDAVEAYRYAAEKGHTGSRWALANMYADGDGVAENDFEAFKIYSEIAREGVEPGSEDTGYFVNALISLASYYRRGIPESPISIDLTQARQLYFQAASTFGVPEAQFQLARMMLSGEGGNASVHQAKKWLNRARNNGHAGAMGLFGNILFQEGQTARGLAFMTAALDHCAPQDRPWLQELQEEAFSVANEEDRRTGVALAQNIRFNSAE
jgi:TPR repeat protein